MLRFLTILAATATLVLAAPNPANLFKIDISPEEAQQYINQLPFSEPQLSGRTNVLPLVRYDSPQFRVANAGPTLGHYWKNGKEIENVDDYVEEVYDAAQFHGQDGLGAYAYGYRAPESSKVENRQSSGDVQGSYTFKSGDNELIKVRYWADSEGFHQEDNRPKVVLEPVQETPEVQAARAAHQKAWEEAAAAALQNPDPQGAYSQNNQYQVPAGQQQPLYDDYQHAASNIRPEVVASGLGQQDREGKAYSSSQAQYQPAKYGQQQQGQQYNQQQYSQQGQYSAQQSAQYGQQQAAPASYGQGQQQGKYEEPEPTGPPRGFFYSFDYPVSIIVRKDAQGQNGPVNPGKPIDHDTVGINAHYQ